MKRFCPACNQIFSGQMLCPNCGVQLSVTETTDSGSSSVFPKAIELPSSQPHLLYRFILGLLLAQGFYYSTYELVKAYWMWKGSPGITQETGWFVLNGLQLGALLIGGIVVGSGQKRGMLAGLALGVVNVILIWFMDQRSHDAEGVIVIFMNGMYHLMAGAIGGLIGRAIWQPVLPLPKYDNPNRSGGSHREIENIVAETKIPLNWSRILAGAVMTFVATVWAESIRTYLVKRIHGSQTGTPMQSFFVTWEIACLLILIGAGFAGAHSRRGVVHGFLVGILASLALIGLQMSWDMSSFSSLAFLKNQFNLPLDNHGFNVVSCLFTVGHTMLISILGGWLGSRMLTPLRSPHHPL